MGRIVVRGQFPFVSGRAAAGRAAARVLRETVLRDHRGVLVYEFYSDPSGESLAIIEVYESEAALIAHIDASDFSGLFANLDFAAGRIAFHGQLSSFLLQKLKPFEPFQVFAPLTAD